MDNPASQSAPDAQPASHFRQILANLPVTNVPVACDILEALLKSMQQSPPPVAEYMAVLETAREPLAFLQDAVAARYGAKPLPPTEDENAAFARTVLLWRLMADGYAALVRLGGTDPEVQKQMALVCQRSIHYAGQVVTEYFRGRRAVPAGVWTELHGRLQTAADRGLANVPVNEPIGVEGPTTVTETYAATLLVDLANPYSRAPKELAWVSRWARLLAPATRITRPDDNAGGRGYGIDLTHDSGLLPVDHLAATPSARLFDTSALGERVQSLFARVKAGESPESLGLGNDCPPARAARLLAQLYRPWCLAAMPRRFQRTRASGVLAVAYGLESIHFHITGGDFTQPQHTRSYSRAQVEELWTFRNQLDPTRPLNLRSTQVGHTLDIWDVADQSLNGFRAFRNAAGPRVEHGQLLALKPPGGDQFALGLISWLVLENDGRLQAGIHVLPGPATGVAVRQTGVGISMADPYSRGFFLPPVLAIKEPVSVIVPPGWYVPGRVVEIFTDRPVLAKLGELLAKGPNFERCSFSLVT